MMQVVEQTHEERVKMYLRSTKKQLAEMLATRDEFAVNLFGAQMKPSTWVYYSGEDGRIYSSRS